MTVKVSVGTAKKLNQAAAAHQISVAKLIERLVDEKQPQSEANSTATPRIANEPSKSEPDS